MRILRTVERRVVLGAAGGGTQRGGAAARPSLGGPARLANPATIVRTTSRTYCSAGESGWAIDRTKVGSKKPTTAWRAAHAAGMSIGAKSPPSIPSAMMRSKARGQGEGERRRPPGAEGPRGREGHRDAPLGLGREVHRAGCCGSLSFVDDHGEILWRRLCCAAILQGNTGDSGVAVVRVVRVAIPADEHQGDHAGDHRDVREHH